MRLASPQRASWYAARTASILQMTALQFGLLICLFSITPLLVVQLPPLVDLYGHLGRYAVQTDLANRPEIQPFYSYEWRLIGNLGADLLIQALHGLLGLELSVRVTVIATQFLGAAAILLMSQTVHGRITPFAVASLPLLYGFPFNYGFLNFALGMALAMLAFCVWLRVRQSGSPLLAPIWIGLAGIGIWVCHTYGWAFLGLLCGSTLLAEALAARERVWPTARRIASQGWPLLLPLIPMLIWRADSTGSETGQWELHLKLVWLLSPLRTKWFVVDMVSMVVLWALLYAAIRSKNLKFDPRLGLATLLCLASFLVLPMCVFGSMFADMRLVPYVLIVALLSVSASRLRTGAMRVFTVIAFGFFVGRTLTTGMAYIEQDQQVAGVLPAIDSIPRGARVAFLVIKPCKVPWELPVLDHVAGLALARRSIFVNDQWQQPGVNLLEVHYPAAAPFAEDPSQMVLPDGCTNPMHPNLSGAMATLPRDAFTHVWIIGEMPSAMPNFAGLVPLPMAGQGALYAVRTGD